MNVSNVDEPLVEYKRMLCQDILGCKGLISKWLKNTWNYYLIWFEVRGRAGPS